MKKTFSPSEQSSRRLQKTVTAELNPVDLSQAVDVDISLSQNDEKPAKGLPGYFICGWVKAVERIKESHDLGIRTISLRFISGDSLEKTLPQRVEDFTQTLDNILDALKDIDIKLIVDPFGLALTEGGQWGVMDQNNQFDKELTLALLFNLGSILSTRSVYGIVTLGRIPEEVQVTKAGIVDGGGDTKIFSFSQNSETSTAYVYLDGPSKNTGQKILPGNIIEMDLWALVDIWHGADACIIKPIESYHLISSLLQMLEHDESLHDFIFSEKTTAVANLHPFTSTALQAMRNDFEALQTKCEKVKIAGYTVSGTTYMIALLAKAKSVEMAKARLSEMLITGKAVAGDRFEVLIDRNAAALLKDTVLC